MQVDVTNVPPSADAALKELALAPGALDPKFDPKTLKYAVKQPFGTKTMLVTPTANGPVSKLQVNVRQKHAFAAICGGHFWRPVSSLPISISVSF